MDERGVIFGNYIYDFIRYSDEEAAWLGNELDSLRVASTQGLCQHGGQAEPHLLPKTALQSCGASLQNRFLHLSQRHRISYYAATNSLYVILTPTLLPSSESIRLIV